MRTAEAQALCIAAITAAQAEDGEGVEAVITALEFDCAEFVWQLSLLAVALLQLWSEETGREPAAELRRIGINVAERAQRP